jgi:hypothetical protein
MVHFVALPSSSASLGMAVSTAIIEALDNGIRDQLQRTSQDFFFGVLISAFVVAVGVVLEGPEILHELWPSLFTWFTWTSNERLHKFERAIKKVAFLGWLLIGIGVFGEGVFEGLQNRAEGQLQTFNGILLKDAQRESGNASQRAASAFERAAETEREASQENERAAKTEQQASEENARAAQALKAAEIARKDAEGLSLQIAQANQRASEANRIAQEESLKRAQIEARLAPRTVTPAQQKDLTSRLTALGPHDLDVLIYGDTPEILHFADLIDAPIRDAGWNVRVWNVISGGYATGVLVRTLENSGNDPPADLLVKSLNIEDVVATRWASFSKAESGLKYIAAQVNGPTWDDNKIAPIRLIIGAKP